MSFAKWDKDGKTNERSECARIRLASSAPFSVESTFLPFSFVSRSLSSSLALSLSVFHSPLPLWNINCSVVSCDTRSFFHYKKIRNDLNAANEFIWFKWCAQNDHFNILQIRYVFLNCTFSSWCRFTLQITFDNWQQNRATNKTKIIEVLTWTLCEMCWHLGSIDQFSGQFSLWYANLRLKYNWMCRMSSKIMF